MFISTWLFYLLIITIGLALVLQAHSVYIVQEARSTRAGVTSSIVGRIIINLLLAIAANSYIIYYILTKKNGGI